MKHHERRRSHINKFADIDYEKLAMAIVKANFLVEKEKTIEVQPKENVKQKRHFFKTAWRLIKGEDTDDTMTISFFAGMTSALFRFFAVISLFIATYLIFSFFGLYLGLNILIEFPPSYMHWVFALSFLVLSFFFLCIGGELNSSKDKNYIVNIFSIIISTVALVVAIIS